MSLLSVAGRKGASMNENVSTEPSLFRRGLALQVAGSRHYGLGCDARHPVPRGISAPDLLLGSNDDGCASNGSRARTSGRP